MILLLTVLGNGDLLLLLLQHIIFKNFKAYIMIFKNDYKMLVWCSKGELPSL